MRKVPEENNMAADNTGKISNLVEVVEQVVDDTHYFCHKENNNISDAEEQMDIQRKMRNQSPTE
jgi:uncharacterized spore protein YtfJ